MSTRSHNIRLAARALFALTLGIWLSGAGCLACCAGESAERTDARRVPSEVSTARLSSSSSAHCPAHAPRVADDDVAKREAAHESSGAALSGHADAAPCCGNVGQTAGAAHKPRVAPASSSTPSSPLAPPHKSAHPGLSCARGARAFVPDRGGTHARLCVFLI